MYWFAVVVGDNLRIEELLSDPIFIVSFVPATSVAIVSRMYRFPASSPIICITLPMGQSTAKPVSYVCTEVGPIPAIRNGAEYAVEVPVGALILKTQDEFSLLKYIFPAAST